MTLAQVEGTHYFAIGNSPISCDIYDYMSTRLAKLVWCGALVDDMGFWWREHVEIL